MTPCATHLIQPAADAGADNETHAKEGLQIGKHGADICWEFPGDDGEAGGEECGVANRLDYPDDKAERDEDPRVVKVVQQPEEDRAGASGEDAKVEHPAGAPCVDLGANVGAGDEHGELKYAEYKAILCTRG